MFDETARNGGLAPLEAPVRASIVVDDPEAAATAAGEFDKHFGDSHWRFVSRDGVEAELKCVPARPRRDELYLFAIAASEARAIDRIERSVAELARLGVMTALLTETLPGDASDRLARAGAMGRVAWPVPERGFEPLFAQIAERRGAQRDADRRGRLITFLRASGGAGATTLAVNLGWELALATKGQQNVGLLDLDLQYGGMSAYAEGAPDASVADLLLAPTMGSANDQLFAMVRMRRLVALLPAPNDMVSLSDVSPRTLDGVVVNALTSFDYVVADMPITLTSWTKTVLERSSAVYMVARRLDANEAINLTKSLRALEDLGAPVDKIELVLNDAPGPLDLARRLHATRFEKSVGRPFDVRLPDGGESVAQASRAGAPLAEAAQRSPLRAALRDQAKRHVFKSDKTPADAFVEPAGDA